jgi:hypothetical protein
MTNNQRLPLLRSCSRQLKRSHLGASCSGETPPRLNQTTLMPPSTPPSSLGNIPAPDISQAVAAPTTQKQAHGMYWVQFQ